MAHWQLATDYWLLPSITHNRDGRTCDCLFPEYISVWRMRESCRPTSRQPDWTPIPSKVLGL
jgi:hypothetical protein